MFLYLFFGFFFFLRKTRGQFEVGGFTEDSEWVKPPTVKETEFQTRTLWASSLLWKRGNFSTRVRDLNVVLKVLLTNITVISFINTHLVCITHIYDVFFFCISLKTTLELIILVCFKNGFEIGLSSWRWLRGWRGWEGGSPGIPPTMGDNLKLRLDDFPPPSSFSRTAYWKRYNVSRSTVRLSSPVRQMWTCRYSVGSADVGPLWWIAVFE